MAVFTSARCENACGKLPTWRLAADRILRQQADIVAQGEQMLEQSAGVVLAAEHQVGVGEPEAACQEGALAGRQARLYLAVS